MGQHSALVAAHHSMLHCLAGLQWVCMCQLAWKAPQALPDAVSKEENEKNRKGKTTPFGVNLMRSQALYRAAQVYQSHRISIESCGDMLRSLSSLVPAATELET